MEIFQSIKLITVPRWFRMVVLLAAILLVGFNVFLLYLGLSKTSDVFYIGAAGQLLAVVLPIVIVILFFAVSHGGLNALRDRTSLFLITVLPDQLAFIPEFDPLAEGRSKPDGSPGILRRLFFKNIQCDDEFFVVRNVNRKVDIFNKREVHVQNRLAKVSYRHAKNTCYCDYKISIPRKGDGSKELRIRVEINIFSANVNILFPSRVLDRMVTETVSTRDVIQKIIESGLTDTSVHSQAADSPDGAPFGNTLFGARGAGYNINPALIDRSIDKEPYEAIVLSKSLSKDFLWDSAEQLHFAQDVMFMLRALVTEDDGILCAYE